MSFPISMVFLKERGRYMMRGDAVNSHSIYLHYIGQTTLEKWTEHSILVKGRNAYYALHNL